MSSGKRYMEAHEWDDFLQYRLYRTCYAKLLE